MGASPSSPFGPSPSIARLLRPLLTSRAVGGDSSPTSPFQAWGEISPGKNINLHRTTAGYTSPSFDHESFAVFSPLALLGAASDPISVRRPAASLPASSRRFLTVPPLRLASVTVINFRKDFHLQVDAHAGRTERSRCAAGFGDLKRQILPAGALWWSP